MYLNFISRFVLLCCANRSNSFANKIAFSSQRKQIKHFDSMVLHVAMQFIKFYYFFTHHLIGVRNNVNWT